MAKIADFKELIGWQKSHLLVLRVYQTTSKFPKEEIFALTGHLKRASVSMSSNTPEGFCIVTLAHLLSLSYIL